MVSRLQSCNDLGWTSLPFHSHSLPVCMSFFIVLFPPLDSQIKREAKLFNMLTESQKQLRRKKKKEMITTSKAIIVLIRAPPKEIWHCSYV